MSEEDGQQEPSMEEILASIRKIISEDEEQEHTREEQGPDTPELEPELEAELEPEPN